VPTATPNPAAVPTTTAPLVPPTIGSVTTPTYNASTIVAGSRTATLSKIYINNDATAVTYASATSWQKTLNLSLGNNIVEVLGEESNGVKTTPVTTTIVRHKLSDISGDGVITLTDISLFGVDWLKTSNLSNKLSDMNEDSIVNLTDFSIIAKQYGQ
jgi:hypothetical protein